MAWVIEILSWFTGRAFWFDVFARIAEHEGNKKDAIEFRNAAFHERLRKNQRRA